MAGKLIIVCCLLAVALARPDDGGNGGSGGSGGNGGNVFNQIGSNLPGGIPTSIPDPSSFPGGNMIPCGSNTGGSGGSGGSGGDGGNGGNTGGNNGGFPIPSGFQSFTGR